MEKEQDNSYHKINLNWYPGHMAKTKKQIQEDLKLIDVVVEVLDARIPMASSNPDIQERIKNKKKIISIILIILSVIFIGANTYAHSGRTDSNGGHKDNKNKSGLGSYHYHCGGYPAHLHTNGVCPYSSNSSTAANKNSKTTSGRQIMIWIRLKISEM